MPLNPVSKNPASRFYRIVFLILVLTLPSSPLAALEANKATSFINGLGGKAITMLTEPTLEDSTRQARFRKLFEENFDLPIIARFVLGRYWSQATEAQQKEFQSLLEDYIVLAYSSRFKEYNDETFEVNDVRQDGGEDAIVYTRIIRRTAPSVRVDWRVHEPNAGIKVIDVSIEGLSMVLTHRNEFAAVIQRAGSGIDGLLEILRKKTEGVNRGLSGAS